MKPCVLYNCFHILFLTVPAHFLTPPSRDTSRPVVAAQKPIMAGELGALASKLFGQGGPGQGAVLLSDVMGRDRSINVFAGFVRDVESVARRLDDATQNSTVLAPLNSAVDKLDRKPWEDRKDYDALGADAYDGDEGQGRARRNMRRFVEAHIVPMSPWPEGQKVKSVLDGDGEIWWENKDGVKVIQPGNIEVSSAPSQVGNGEVWIIRGVRNYS